MTHQNPLDNYGLEAAEQEDEEEEDEEIEQVEVELMHPDGSQANVSQAQMQEMARTSQNESAGRVTG